MDDDNSKLIQEQFELLPKVVQDAINSTKMEEQFQTLVKKHGLHIDQWDALEDQIMLTVLGLADPEELEEYAIKEIGIEPEKARAVIDDVAVTVFKPIREELDRELGSPQAKDEALTDVEKARNEVLAGAKSDGSLREGVAPSPTVDVIAPPNLSSAAPSPAPQPAPVAPSIVPATPPAPPPTEKAVRAPMSSSYDSQKPSSERKSVEGDPYRTPPV